MRLNIITMIRSKDADRMASIVDFQQAASNLEIFTVCPDMSIWIF